MTLKSSQHISMSAKSAASRWQFLFMAIIFTVMAAALTSCDEDDFGDPYESYLYGQWDLIAINGAPVPQYMESEFYFDPSGYGTMGQYDSYGLWATYDITWEVSGNYLYVSPRGWNELWTYTWTVQGDYLYLYDTSTGNTLTYVLYY